MTDTDEALIPLEVLREMTGMPASTMRRKLTQAGVTSVRYSGGRAVRWGEFTRAIGGDHE